MLRINVPPITSMDDLLNHLQKAIELEHATIPPYLTALYTLAGDSPSVEYAREIIQSVVIEEMLHMTLASNILNALGGHPVINQPGFVPNYPGPLPMGIGDHLIVPLKKYSTELVTNIFMEIEEPEDPLVLQTKSVNRMVAATPDPYETIGEFYTAIKDYILNHTTQSDFKGKETYQVTDWFHPGELVKVTDASSAAQAIDVIIEQGEGSSTSAGFEDDGEEEAAHFYKFQSLSKGMRLVETNSSPWFAFSSDPKDKITIDPITDVINMVDNPSEVDYSSNQRAVLLSNQCDYIYTKILNALHNTFNGHPDTMMNAVGTMFEFKNAVGQLLRVKIDTVDGQPVYAGPKFLYSETNPNT